jgi:hypothetical protein
MENVATVNERITKAASIIAADPLKDTLSKWRVEDLNRALEDTTTTYLSLEFNAPDIVRSSVSFYVNTSTEGFETDDKGDVYYVQNVHTSTSWPSYGSAKPEDNERRLAFMVAVNELAGRVSKQCDGQVRTLHKTAAEVAKFEADREAAKVAAKLNGVALQVVGMVCKMMRVSSQERMVPIKLVEELQAAGVTEKEVTISDRTYHLRISRLSAGVRRTR